MPLIIFLLSYITGILLSFTSESNFAGFYPYSIIRIGLFMKIKRRAIFIHILVYQCLNIVLFLILTAFYFLLSENTLPAVYNIYKWISLVLFAAVMLITAADAAVLERNGKGSNDEDN